LPFSNLWVIMQSAAIDSLFRSGELLMPTEPSGFVSETVHQWSDTPVAGLLVVIFTILAIINIRNFITILPSLQESFLRYRGSYNLETRVRLMRARSIVSMVLIIPFCLIAHRYTLLHFDFLDNINPNFGVLATCGIFLAYAVLRWLMVWQLEPKRKSREAYQVAHRASHTFFIIMTSAELVAIGILSIAGASDELIRSVLQYIVGFVYLVYVWRRIQILDLAFSSFIIILYLCALEILPTGLLLAAAKLF